VGYWAGFFAGGAQGGPPPALPLWPPLGTHVNIVKVNSAGTGGAQASPYTMQPYDYVIADTSTGNVVLNGGSLTSGQWYAFKHSADTSLATNTLTVNGVGANLEKPLGPPGGNVNPGTFAGANAVVLAAESERGTSCVWVNGGSAAGYDLAQ
jgi:hypothetical protein